MNFQIKEATLDNAGEIIKIWEECNLTRPWNNPNDDTKNAILNSTSTILLLCDESRIIGTVMVGYDGHRGWIYYLAVAKEFQKMGIGKKLVREAESWLKANNIPKVNLMIRSSNIGVKQFYKTCDYMESDVITMEKWLNNKF